MIPVAAQATVDIAPAIWIGAFGVIIGAGFGVLTTLINNRHQRALARENNQRADRLARENNSFTLTTDDRRLKRERLEEAHQLLSLAAQEFSLTTSNNVAQAQMSVDDWNKRYQRTATKLRRLQMIADLYVPAMSDTVRALNGKGNVFWGQQQGLLYQLSLGNSRARDTFGLAIVQAANEVDALVGRGKDLLVEEAERSVTESRDIARDS